MRRELKVEFRPGAEPMQQPALGELDLPGEDGSYASTPHVAALAITAELDVRIDLTHQRWCGDRLQSTRLILAHSPLVAKYVTTGDQRSWMFHLRENGRIGLRYSADGSTIDSVNSDRAPYVRGGGRTVIRFTYESDVGGTERRIRFYQGFGINGPWVLLSEHSETGTQTLFNATSAPLEIGTYSNGAPGGAWQAQAMTVHQVQVRDGIDGTVVANPVFSGHTEGETAFTDSAGLDWAVNGDAHISADVPVPDWVTLSAGGPHGNRAQSAEWRIGRERDDEDWPPGEATLELASPDRLFDPENSAGTYDGLLEPRTPFRLSAPDDTVSALNLPEARTFLDHPGGSGDNATCPASSQIGTTGDIDIRVKARLDDWAPVSSQRLLSRGGLGSAGDFSWRWSVFATGVIFEWSPDGSNSTTVSSSVPLVFAAGSEHWIRVTLRPDGDFGNHEVRFWVSEDGEDWIELGSPQTGIGSNRLWGGSQPLATGRPDTAANNLQGEVLQIEVRDGINGRIVASPDFTRLPPGITSFTDDHGNLWTVAGAASVDLDTSTRSWVSTPDHADFSFALTMRLRIEASLEDWRPGHDVVLLSKWEETGDQRSWILALTGDGRLVGTHSTTGADEIVRTTSAQVTPGPGGRLVVEALLLTNFFGGSLWIFSTGTDGIDGDVTELEQVTVNAGSTTSLFDSTAPVEIGTFNGGTTSDPYRQLAGIVHAARINDDGTVVADPDFTADAAGDPSVTDSTGKVWTLQGDAELIQDPAFVGDLFYGFVEDGWEQTHVHPEDGYTTVTLTDLFGVLPGEVLPSPFESAILDTSPVAYWRLNEAIGRTGEEVSDQSEHQHTGMIVGSPTFGQPALFAGLGDAALFDKGDQGDQLARVDISRSRIGRDPFNESVVAVFSTDTRPPNQAWIHEDVLVMDVDGNVDFDTSLHVMEHVLSIWHTGQIRSQAVSTAFGGGDAVLGPVVDDGQPHLVFAQRNGFGPNDGIGVDSPILDNSSIDGAVFERGIGASIGGLAHAPGGWTDNQFNGTLQHVAVWDRPLTQADRDHIYEHLDGLNSKRSDEQLRWTLERLGVPEDLLSLDEGVTTMGVVDSAGKDALVFAREIDATEGGAFFVDHANGGKLRFRSRYVRWLHHRSRIDQETFSDDPAATGVVRVEKGSLIVQPKGVSTVVNTWTVTWAGGEETATDAPSRKRYGPRGDTIDTQAPSSAYARGLARFNLALTKEPRTLVRGLGINPAAAHAGFPAAIGSQIWDRAGFRHQPLATGSVSTRELQIEGAKHQVNDMHWTTDFFTGTAADEHQQLFLADISATDGDHVAAP